jgi:hypothetical protein
MDGKERVMDEKAVETRTDDTDLPEALDDEAAELRRRELLERLGQLAAYTTPVMLAMMSTARPAAASEI